jgi:large subunit ribosomal protein L22
MEYGKCIARFVKVRPRKARLIADLIRGKRIEEAGLTLEYCGQRAGLHLRKALNSAIANAENQHDVRREDLSVLEVRVDEGPTMKRAKARSRGSRSPIIKRTSHLTVVVGKEL